MTSQQRLALMSDDEEKLSTEADEGSQESVANDAAPLGENIYALLIAEVTQAWTRAFGAPGKDRWLTVARIIYAIVLVTAVIAMQVFLLQSVSTKLCNPAVREVREIYDKFQTAIYGENTYITVNGFHRGKDGAEVNMEGFRALSQDTKVAICSVPLSQPYFTYTILLIWTMTCLAEIRRAVRLLYATLISIPTVKYVEEVLEETTIKGMTRGMKFFIGISCFLPRIAATMLLNFLGCRWLLSTVSLQDLFLNSLALEFMVVLPELLYNTFATDRGQKLTQATILAGDSASSPKGTSLLVASMWVFAALLWVFLYMVYVQQVLPGYNWDVRPVCRANPEVFAQETFG